MILEQEFPLIVSSYHFARSYQKSDRTQGGWEPANMGEPTPGFGRMVFEVRESS